MGMHNHETFRANMSTDKWCFKQTANLLSLGTHVCRHVVATFVVRSLLIISLRDCREADSCDTSPRLHVGFLILPSITMQVAFQLYSFHCTELIEVCDFMDFVDDVIPNSSLDAVDPFISINVDDNDLDKLVNTDDLTISSPGVVVSPSYKKVLLQEPSPNQSIHSDILFPSPLSPELLDPSHDSSHVVDDVKCISPSPLLPSASASSPWVNVGESRIDNLCDQSAISVLATNCLDTQKLEDITPNSSYSDPHPSDHADVLVKVMNPPVPTFSPVKEVDPLGTSPPRLL